MSKPYYYTSGSLRFYIEGSSDFSADGSGRMVKGRGWFLNISENQDRDKAGLGWFPSPGAAERYADQYAEAKATQFA